MNRLISFFVKYPYWTNVFILVTLLAGGLAFMATNRSFFPEKNIKTIYVDVSYPGASPEEMEETVTNKIEESIEGIVGIDESTSTSRENFSQVVITITNRAEIDQVLADVTNAVDQINSFPSGAERPNVYKDKGLDFCMRTTLTGDNNLLKTKEVAELIYDDLLRSGVVSQVDVSGVGDPEISIEIKENVLEQYGISFLSLQQQIVAFNQDLTIGSIRSKQQEVSLRYKNKETDPSDLRAIPIISSSGNEVLLGDLATVDYQLPPDQGIAVLQGKPSVNIKILKLPQEDILEINDYVNSYIEEFNKKNDLYHIHVIFDASEEVRGRLNLLKSNGIIGLFLVLIVLGIFLSFRLSFWVAVGIPVSFLGMFIFASFFDITVNQISMFGMILVIGILVDDGIVISENIYSKIEGGMRPKDAAIQGTTEVLPAVFTSVMTTVLVFSTFFFIDGPMGDIIPEMGLVVIGCLLYSLIEAALLLPAHLNDKALQKTPGKIREKINSSIDFLRNRLYGKYLRTALNWKWVFLTGGVCLVAMGVALFKSDKVGKSFFPNLESSLININLAFYPGQSANKTEEFLKEINAEIVQVSDSLARHYEEPPIITSRYTVGASTLASGNHAGVMEIRLARPEKRILSNTEISTMIREKLDLKNRVPQSTIGGRDRFGKPISYKLVSRNLEQLEKAQTYFKEELSKIPQVADVTDNSDAGNRELRFELTEKAINLGFTPNDVITELRKRFFGSEIQKL